MLSYRSDIDYNPIPDIVSLDSPMTAFQEMLSVERAKVGWWGTEQCMRRNMIEKKVKQKRTIVLLQMFEHYLHASSVS